MSEIPENIIQASKWQQIDPYLRPGEELSAEHTLLWKLAGQNDLIVAWLFWTLTITLRTLQLQGPLQLKSGDLAQVTTALDNLNQPWKTSLSEL
jgi:hypothetical protein